MTENWNSIAYGTIYYTINYLSNNHSLQYPRMSRLCAYYWRKFRKMRKHVGWSRFEQCAKHHSASLFSLFILISAKGHKWRAISHEMVTPRIRVRIFAPLSHCKNHSKCDLAEVKRWGGEKMRNLWHPHTQWCIDVPPNDIKLPDADVVSVCRHKPISEHILIWFRPRAPFYFFFSPDYPFVI